MRKGILQKIQQYTVLTTTIELERVYVIYCNFDD